MKLLDYAMGLTLGFLLSAAQESLYVRAAPSPTPNPQDASNNQVSYSSSISSSSSMPSHPLGGQSIVYGMAVTPSDLSISYVPELAWVTRSSQQDSASCLAGTKSSSTPGSYLEYKFTGSGIQLYTAASATAGSFTVSLDGSPYGSFSISKDESGQGQDCAARLLVDINSLPNTPHTLKVTVVEGPTGPDGLNFVFAGLGLSSVSSNGSLLRNNTAAVDPASSKNNVGAIVGAALGSVASVLFIALGLFFLVRRQRRAAAAKAAAATQTPVGPSKTMEDDQKTLCSADSDNDLKSKV